MLVCAGVMVSSVLLSWIPEKLLPYDEDTGL